jgi:DNA-binding SARP family transcriptional activator/tetratricopeptide (TPR) repeat protein
VQFRVLGGVEVVADDGRVSTLSRRRERCMLGILLLETGRALPIDRLCTLLWDGEPPTNARANLRTHAARIRAVLAQAGAGDQDIALVCNRSTYQLAVPSGAVDAHRFRALVDQAARTGDLTRREKLLHDALAMWRGPALADAATERIRERVCADLDELHVTAVEDSLATGLDLGRHRELLPDLAQLTAEHPTRERLIELQMLALYRCGRSSDALNVYARVRTQLAEDLGLDPGTALQQLHTAILRGQPLAAATSEPRPAAAVAVKPAQLPPDLAAFAGRAEQLERLDALLDTGATGEAPSTVVISAIAGIAGVGKTTLAVHWGHRAVAQFPDGQLYLNLRGFDPGGVPLEPAEAVRSVLESLGVPPQRVPGGLAARTALYRSLLAGRRMLILLDNAGTAEQVRPLLAGTSGCVVLVTSRNRLLGLATRDGAHLVELHLLSDAEARELLAARIGRERVEAEPASVARIVAACGRLPIALAVGAAHAAANPRLRLQALAEQLDASRGSLDAFDGGDPSADLRAVFSWSYAALDAPAARLFRLLGLHPGPHISAAAMVSLAGTAPPQTARWLRSLVHAGLVSELSTGLYGLHDLLRAYARELALAMDDEQERRAALHRTLDHYLHSAVHADAAVNVYRDDPVEPEPARPGVVPERLAGHQQGLAWLVAEEPVLLAVVHLAASAGFEAHTWRLAQVLMRFLDRRGHWPESVAVQRLALDAAVHAGDARGRSVASSCLACALIRVGRHEEAAGHLRAALDGFTGLGDDAGMAYVHRAMAWTLDGQGRHREALADARRARRLFAMAGHRSGEARALNATGWFHSQLGDHPAALRECLRALRLQREIGDRINQADTLDSLGHVYRLLGRHGDAAGCYREAVAIYRDFGDRYNQADSLVTLGDARAEAGEPAEAAEAWRLALDIFDQLHHPDAQQARNRLTLVTMRSFHD